MRQQPFQVGDKVVLTHAVHATMATIPRLVPGRVYCVRQVSLSKGTSFCPVHQRLHLCGVRGSKRLSNPNYGLPFAAYRHVGSNAKEAA